MCTIIRIRVGSLHTGIFQCFHNPPSANFYVRIIRDPFACIYTHTEDLAFQFYPKVDEVEVLLYVHRNSRFIRNGSPGRPPDFHTAPEL